MEIDAPQMETGAPETRRGAPESNIIMDETIKSSNNILYLWL
jgi:hypothetical protein